jgi:hypothetical protein
MGDRISIGNVDVKITWRWHRFIFGFEVYDSDTHELDKLGIDTFELYIFIGFICIWIAK